MKSVSKTTKIAVGAAILAVGGFSGIGLAHAAQVSSAQQAEVTHSTPVVPAAPAVPAAPELPAAPVAPAAPAAPAFPSADGSAAAGISAEGVKGAGEGSVDATQDGASVSGSADAKGAAGAAYANAELSIAVSGTSDVPATPSVELPELDK
jgi:hypothetical protein